MTSARDGDAVEAWPLCVTPDRHSVRGNRTWDFLIDDDRSIPRIFPTAHSFGSGCLNRDAGWSK
jgi:hypothetical protein